MKNKPWMLIGFAGALLALVIAATVTPGLRISEYPNTTSPNANDLFLLADITSIPRTNRNYKWSSLTNFIHAADTVVSNGVSSKITNSIIVSGTNTFVTSNVVGNTITFTVNIASNLIADGVWTNNGGIIHPRVSNGQETNSIQVYTNGGLSIGANTLPFWVTQPGAGGETLVSMRDSAINFNEIFIGVPNLVTNEVWQDFFMHSGLNRRRIVLETPTEQLVQDQYVDDGSNFVFGASGTTFGNVWKFQPGSISSPQYFFDTVRPVATNVHLFDVNNFGTNQVSIYGDGKVNIVGQITNQFLTASKLVATDANKGLVSSTLDETGITNLISTLATNNVKVTAGTNVVVITNVSGSTITYNINMASIVGSLTGTTNWINLSVQAAKFPTTDYAAVSGFFQNWELYYYKTNESGTITPLSASWQFVVPPDYATNTMQVYLQSTITATNGPNTSNVVWRASFFRAASGDGRDLHTNVFGATVTGTNDWAASSANHFRMQSLQIDMSTNSLLQANDLAILKVERVSTADTVVAPSALVNLQLRYVRQ